tara:strand:+ start:944 stop:2431 length:1488 start_codon:yes stop_codon:yes gene_type:complete
MGALPVKRFRDNHKASGGPYKGQGYVDIALNKIKDKREFIIGTKSNGAKVYGLKLIKDKDKFILSYTSSKSSKQEAGRKSIGSFFKDPDFGGGKGSGGGSDDTAVTESMQCYYLSILFNGNPSKLDNKNTELSHLKAQQNYCFTFDKSKKLKAEDCFEACPEDWFKDDVFIKTANAIYNSEYAKPFKNAPRVYFHRGSPYMKSVYENKKKAQVYDKKLNKTPVAPGSFSDDKWNPGDIWMSTKNPTDTKPFVDGKKYKKEPLEWTDLREAVRDTADTHTLGISLKKIGGASARVTPFNTRQRTHNIDTKFSGFSFGQTGDFFKSADVYMYFSDGGIMQLRATATTKSWQGEMKGKYAAAGKIGGGNINHYVEQIFNKSIGYSGTKGTMWSETYYKESNLVEMHKLYQRFINKQKSGTKKQEVVELEEFKKLADGYINNKKQPAAPAFYFGKYMGLLFLKTIDADKRSTKLNEFSRYIVRYAMSNTDISTFFIKVS